MQQWDMPMHFSTVLLNFMCRMWSSKLKSLRPSRQWQTALNQELSASGTCFMPMKPILISQYAMWISTTANPFSPTHHPSLLHSYGNLSLFSLIIFISSAFLKGSKHAWVVLSAILCWAILPPLKGILKSYLAVSQDVSLICDCTYRNNQATVRSRWGWGSNPIWWCTYEKGKFGHRTHICIGKKMLH